MKSALSIIISREYFERVKRKSFIITTLLMPIFMVLISLAPAALMIFSTPESKNVAVIDDSGAIARSLEDSEEIKFISYSEPLDSLRAREDVEAILVIGAKAVDNPNSNITLYYRGAPSMATDSYIQHQLKEAIRDRRIEAYNIENIRQILEEVEVDLSYPTIRIDKDEDTGTSSTLSYLLGMMLDLMLYMFIIIYGTMVMNSIIEEKNNRVLEIVVSSVKPIYLMMGKVLGIGLVAITQILIWTVIISACSAWILPMTMSMPQMADEPEVLAALGQLSDTGFMLKLMLYMLLFFIGGYLFYSSIYAAIGSAVDNAQDAAQLSNVATMPIIISIVGSMAVVQNPNSGLAFWLSIIPFSSPMTMMCRLPYDVPTWEVLLSLVLLYLSFLGLMWICAKIYRVGIFMYGKKPTFVEIIRWAKYK